MKNKKKTFFLNSPFFFLFLFLSPLEFKISKHFLFLLERSFSPLEASAQSERIDNSENTKKKPLQKKTKVFKPHPKQLLKGVHFIETSDSKKIWELWSEEMFGMRSGKNWLIKNIKLIFFSTESNHFKVQSKKGWIENLNQKKNVILEEDVEIQSTNEYRFKTRKIEYKGNPQILISQTPLEITGPKNETHNFKLNANEMKIFIRSSMIEFKGNINGFYIFKSPAFEKKQKIYIQSEMLTFYGSSKQMKFSKNVKIQIGMFQLKSPEALFHYDEKNDQLNMLKLTQGIELHYLNKKASAESLDFDIIKNSLTLRKNIQMTFENKEIKGNEITLTQFGKQMKIRKAKIKTALKNPSKNKPIQQKTSTK